MPLDLPKPSEATALWDDHARVISGMSEEARLVMARELMAARMRQEFQAKRGMILTRQESLEAVFAAEVEAREKGAVPKVDFFLPLENDFMEVTI